MSIEENMQIVKEFFAAIGSSNRHDLLALVAEDIEWIIPGENWPLAGTHRGHADLAAVLQKASEEVEMTYPKPPEFVAHGDRVLVIGVAWMAGGFSEDGDCRLRRLAANHSCDWSSSTYQNSHLSSLA